MRATCNHLAGSFLLLAAILTVGCSDSPPTAPVLGSPTITAPWILGAIEITVSTLGAPTDIDPDGYIINVDGIPRRIVNTNETWTIGRQTIGSHLVQLDGLASNCSVKTDNPRRVEVIPDQASPVSFSVVCIAKNKGDGQDKYEIPAGGDGWGY